MARTARRVLVFAVPAVAAVLLLLPFWFPPLLGRVLGHYEVDVQHVSRQGYGALRLEGVRHRSGAANITVRQVVLPQPATWLRWRWFDDPTHPRAAITVDGWEVVTVPQTNAPARAGEEPLRVAALLDDLATAVARFGPWLPPTVAREGRLKIGDHEIELPEARWDTRRIGVRAGVERLGTSAQLAIEPTGSGGFALELNAEPGHTTATAELVPTAGDWALTGRASWHGNPLVVSARFGRNQEGVWPDTLEVKAPGIRVPAPVLTLPGYAELTGSLELVGRGDDLRLEVKAQADPTVTGLPPVRLDLGARLAPEALRLERLECRTPWLELALSNPVTWHFATRQVDRPFRLAAAAALDAQPWVDARGRVEGEVTVEPGRDLVPQMDLSLRGSGIAVQGVTVDRLSLAAQAVGAGVSRLDLEAGWTNGSRVRLRARDLDVVRRTVATGEVVVAMKPGVLPAGWLPLDFQFVEVSGSFSGALTNLAHRGTLAATRVRVNGLREFALAGDWRGTGVTDLESGLRLQTERAEVGLAGRMRERAAVELTRFSIRPGDDPPLELEGLAVIDWGATGTDVASSGRAVAVRGLVLGNDTRSVAIEGTVRWPGMARLTAGATNLDARLLEGFLDRALPPVTIETLSAGIEAAQGPARWRLKATARVDGEALTPGPLAAGDALVRVARVEADLTGDASGAQLRDLRLSADGEPVFELTGTLPVVAGFLGDGRFWEWHPSDPLDLRFGLVPNARLQQMLAETPGVLAGGLAITGALTGSLAAPEGRVSVRAASIRAPERSPLAPWLPRIEDVAVVLRATPDRLAIESLDLQLAGAPLTATLGVPLDGASWEALAQGQIGVNGSHLDGHLRLPGLGLGAWLAERVPWLRPEGTVTVDLQLRPGWNWIGGLEVSGVGTRPVPMLGPVRGIRGRVELRDRRLTLPGIEAEVGGAIVRLEGWTELPDDPREIANLPRFDFGLTGTGVPLARQAGLIIRGDLDLHLRHGATNVPAVEGTLTFGRSFVLSDLGDLLERRVRTTGGTEAPFRVAHEPMAGWRLAVDVRGEEFLHVRSPVYSGLHSVDLKLRGTLGEPLLLGDARVDRGTVIFPYASLQTQRGIVSFSEEAPLRPRIEALAASRVFGYDVRIEVSGEATAPAVQFSSTPPLTSEAILLMMTAGELPRHQLTYSTTQRLTKLATILGRDVLNKLGAQDAGEERLSFRSGEGISAGGRVTQSVEYRLSDRLSLVGEYDEYDDLNAGIKWRIVRR